MNRRLPISPTAWALRSQGHRKGHREETRGTEVRSTNFSRALTRSVFASNYSFCFDFFLLGAVSSNPPPPPRLLPVTLSVAVVRRWGRMLATRQYEVQLLTRNFFTLLARGSAAMRRSSSSCCSRCSLRVRPHPSVRKHTPSNAAIRCTRSRGGTGSITRTSRAGMVSDATI